MIFRYLKGLLLVSFILFFYIWQQTQSIRYGYKVDNLKRECEKWEMENESWKLKVNEYMSMERLDQIAKLKGLIRPQDKDIIYLDND